MNYTTAVFLINDKVRAIRAVYEATEGASSSIFKTLDQSLKKDDLIVVPTNTRHKMTICKVIDVDLDIDFDSPQPIEWVVAVVDKAAYAVLLEQEAQAVQVIKSAEVRKKREDLKAAMLADIKNETLIALPISTITQ